MIRLIPSLAGWGSLPRATANFMASALVIFCTLWSVHQAEYLIVYRQRFRDMMVTGPHSLYMNQAGLSLLVLFGIVAVSLVLLLGYVDVTQRRIASRLPERWHRALLARWPAVHVPIGPVFKTAVLFAAVQISLYTVQENLESGLSVGLWPGLSVLWGSHITAVPLHAFGAVCGASILWLASLLLRRSTSSLRLARVLAHFAAHDSETERLPSPVRGRIPATRLHVSACGARAPPLAA